jgi:hypothetical protein
MISIDILFTRSVLVCRTSEETTMGLKKVVAIEWTFQTFLGEKTSLDIAFPVRTTEKFCQQSA